MQLQKYVSKKRYSQQDVDRAVEDTEQQTIQELIDKLKTYQLQNHTLTDAIEELESDYLTYEI